jgi:hypothetical protein
MARDSVLTPDVTSQLAGGRAGRDAEAAYRPVRLGARLRVSLVELANVGICENPELANPLRDHLIGPYQHRLWNRQAEGFGSFQVDHHLELRRLLDGQVAGLRAL